MKNIDRMNRLDWGFL